MSARTTMAAALAVACAAALAATDATADRRAQIRRQVEQEGGIVTRQMPGNVLRIALASDAIGEQAIRGIARKMRGLLDREVAVTRVALNVGARKALEAAVRQPETAVTIVVAEDDFLPTVTVAPEKGWGVVNIRALAADNPSRARLEERVQKELWRSLVWIVGESHDENCVMRHATTLAGLDAIGTMEPSPDPMFRLVCGAGRWKIRPLVRSTYLDACYEGWAPAPTNAIQKALWERVRAERERGPTNAIVIPPPNQKK